MQFTTDGGQSELGIHIYEVKNNKGKTVGSIIDREGVIMYLSTAFSPLEADELKEIARVVEGTSKRLKKSTEALVVKAPYGDKGMYEWITPEEASKRLFRQKGTIENLLKKKTVVNIPDTTNYEQF